MVTHACSRFWPVLLLLTAIMLVHPPGARAERIDVNDPSVLGPVLQSINLGEPNPDGFDSSLITEVRYAAGIYSYISAIQTSPCFPSGFGLSEGEASATQFRGDWTSTRRDMGCHSQANRVGGVSARLIL